MENSQDYQIINHDLYNKNKDADETDSIIQYKLDIYLKLARHVWAIVILLAQLDLGVKPDWKRKT